MYAVDAAVVDAVVDADGVALHALFGASSDADGVGVFAPTFGRLTTNLKNGNGQGHEISGKSRD